MSKFWREVRTAWRRRKLPRPLTVELDRTADHKPVALFDVDSTQAEQAAATIWLDDWVRERDDRAQEAIRLLTRLLDFGTHGPYTRASIALLDEARRFVREQSDD